MQQRNLRRLYIAGLIPLGAAAAAHVVATLAGRLDPTYDAVRDAMTETSVALTDRANVWDVYVGMNLGMGIGVAAFFALQLGLALRHFELLVESFWLAATALGVAAVIAAIAIRYWFWAPAAAAGASTILLAIALASWPKPAGSPS